MQTISQNFYYIRLLDNISVFLPFRFRAQLIYISLKFFELIFTQNPIFIVKLKKLSFPIFIAAIYSCHLIFSKVTIFFFQTNSFSQISFSNFTLAVRLLLLGSEEIIDFFSIFTKV